jgi:hypothetical protein
LLLRPAVVILDDAHHADAEETDALLDALADLVARRSIRLLLVGRDPIECVTYLPLHGMIEREAQLLWAGSPALPADQWRALYAATGGMPEPIRRAAAAYRRSGDLARANDWVAEIDAWAHETIWSRLEEHEQRLLAAAFALEAQPWSDRQALVCDSIGAPAETLKPLFQRGLLYSGTQTTAAHPECAAGGQATAVLLYGALRTAAAAQLREDDQLRERVAALATELDSAPEPTPIAPPALADTTAEAATIPALVPAGMELLERVRNALEDSAILLQEQGNDHARQQLAAELAALQAALPNLAEPRLPFARPVAGAPTT